MNPSATVIYTLSLHDALPISAAHCAGIEPRGTASDPGPRSHLAPAPGRSGRQVRSEEHTSELQSRLHLVCRLLLEKKKKQSAVGVEPVLHNRFSTLF